MGRRTLLLVAALLVAALGTSLVFVYVNNVDRRARAGQSPVSVLVAAEDLQAGTSVDEANEAGAFVMSEIPASAAIPDALSDIAPIADKVVLNTIYAGEQIIERKFGEQAQVTTLQIPPEMVAMTIQLPDPAKVANFVAPGQQVAVFFTVPGASGQGLSDLLLPAVPVLAVGSETSGEVTNRDGQEIPTRLVTLGVMQQDAQRVLLAQSTGELYLALRSEDSKLSTGTPIRGQDLFPEQP